MAATQNKWLAAISDSRPTFQTIAQNTGDLVNFKTESNFAIQMMKGSKALQACPLHTITDAMVNIAAIGLSLNPAQKLAYLVPRDGKACLDISYQGLMKLATDTGVVQWAKAELVRKGDDFVWNGFDEKPTHREGDPFDSTREVIGGYVVAKLASGDLMCEKMSREELDKVKDSSKAKKGPWATWPDEMRKKTLIKRAYKSWPKSSALGVEYERMGTAIDVLNQHDGLIDRGAADVVSTEKLINDDQLAEINRLIKESHINPKKILAGFEVEELMDLPADRYEECIERLTAAKKAYDEKQSNKKPAAKSELVDKDGASDAVVVEEPAAPAEEAIMCSNCGEAPVKEEGAACDKCLEGMGE